MRKIGLTEVYMRERGPGPSVTAGVPFFVTQRNKRNNVTDVLLWVAMVLDGPSSIGAVLCRRGQSLHRVCGIAGRTEQLEQWWVDFDV